MLDPQLIEGFSRQYLQKSFDGLVDTPDLHREMWARNLSSAKQVAHAAPRRHAKTTSQTQTLSLAFVLFRVRSFGLIVSATEAMAVGILRNIKAAIEENPDLKEAFGVKRFIKESEADIEVEFTDGAQFKLVAKGAEQRIRGTIWRNKRPDFIFIDDVEDDEAVLNLERRAKLKNWLYSALLPCGSRNCIFRVVGTVMHFSSFLEEILNDDAWVSHRYSAHSSWDDFSNVLWPEHMDEAALRAERQKYINAGLPDAYSREYLNIPLSNENSYFKKEWFQDFEYSDYDAPKEYYVGVDFAISKKQAADRTAIVVLGVNTYGVTFVEHVRKGRWDSKEIIDNLFEVSEMFDVAVWYMERGAIQKSIGPFLNDEMVKRNNYLNVVEMLPSTDKESRAKPIQGRMRSGGIKFDQNAEWYQDLEMEMLRFPRGTHDDQVDALSMIGQNLHNLITPLTAEEEEAEEWGMMDRENPTGRNATTGY